MYCLLGVSDFEFFLFRFASGLVGACGRKKRVIFFFTFLFTILFMTSNVFFHDFNFLGGEGCVSDR